MIKKNIVTAFRWIKSKTDSLNTETKHGKYLLHTNLDEKQKKKIWFFYNVIREVKSTFKCLKSDLDIRPIYHKSDEGTKAHLNLAVLAYWVAFTVRYQLKRKDMHHSWSEIVQILQTHKVVSTRVTKEDDSQVEIRQCTEPNEKVTQLYQALELTQEPLKRRKFVVYPKPPLEKMTTENQEVSTG